MLSLPPGATGSLILGPVFPSLDSRPGATLSLRSPRRSRVHGPWRLAWQTCPSALVLTMRTPPSVIRATARNHSRSQLINGAIVETAAACLGPLTDTFAVCRSRHAS